MKKKIIFFTLTSFLAGIMFVSFASCKKNSAGKPVNYDGAPRKPVPASLVGKWLSTHVSGSVITYPGGRTEPTWGSGVAFELKADGTGICVASYETHGPAAESYSRVDQDCTFEITVDQANNTMVFTFYVLRGKVYENNVFLHDLEPAKCYPAKTFSYTCTFGENSHGKYFQSGEDIFFKKS